MVAIVVWLPGRIIVKEKITFALSDWNIEPASEVNKNLVRENDYGE